MLSYLECLIAHAPILTRAIIMMICHWLNFGPKPWEWPIFDCCSDKMAGHYGAVDPIVASPRAEQQIMACTFKKWCYKVETEDSRTCLLYTALYVVQSTCRYEKTFSLFWITWSSYCGGLHRQWAPCRMQCCVYKQTTEEVAMCQLPYRQLLNIRSILF